MEIQVIDLKCVDSTNRYVCDSFSSLPDGALVVAEEQTAGRGRLSRTWHSPAGKNVYATCAMKRLGDPFFATAAASLAVLDTLRDFAPDVSFYIKWPNDVYSGMNKICGVLSEGVLTPGGAFAGVAAGMGINVNSDADDFRGIDGAASLHTLTGNVFSVKKVVSALAKNLSACYSIYLTSPDELRSRWVQENRLVGRELEFETPSGRRFRSVLRGIGPGGEALIEEDGEERVFLCGDIRVVKKTWNPN